jgi:glutathione synthase/RimK-type ligase-like ATP-grasp enzyme
MILLWGVSRDDPLTAVHRALREVRAPVALVDQQQLAAGRIEVHVCDGLPTRITFEDGHVDLADVTAVYLRPYDSRHLVATSVANKAAQMYAAEEALTFWSETTSATVVNRPSAMASNNSKPYQLQLIREHGFDVPDTLVTTDPAAVEAFHEEHGEVIYKSVSGVRSIVSRLHDIDRLRLAEIANCPTQFQEHIPGIDLRVHVVGDMAFACEISSDADDYRYPKNGATLDVATACLTAEQLFRCRSLAHALGLQVAGIDLRVNGPSWYCLEVNPSPGFTFYEEYTGQPIAEAIVDLLMAAA